MLLHSLRTPKNSNRFSRFTGFLFDTLHSTMIFQSYISSLLVGSLALSSIVSASPVSLDRRTGSTPVLQGDPVLIDSEGVYIRVTRLSDDSLIAGYAALDGTTKILRTARSTDNAASWSALGEVFRGEDAEHDIDNAFPIQLDSGRILYAYRNHDRTDDGDYTYYRISISYSDDGGVTFKYLSTVDERTPSGTNGLWEPFLRIANDGSLQAYYSAENAADDQDGLVRTSTDGGQTWSAATTISGADVTSRDGMIGVAPIDNNGNLIAVFENTENGEGFSVDSVTSSDDGATWGNRQRVYTAADGHTAGAPQAYNVWGTLVVSFMTDEDHADLSSYNGGDMKVITSTDGAATWSDSFVTGPAPAHWPGLFNLDENHFLALYSTDTGYGAVSQKVQLN